MVKIPLNARNIIIGLSLILYLVSLFCPIYYAEAICSDGPSRSVPCFWEFLMGIFGIPFELFFLFFGEVDFSLIWVFNIVYFYNLRLLKQKKINIIVKILNIISMIIIPFFYFIHSSLSGRDDEILYEVGDKGIGYFLWSISLYILFILYIFMPISEKGKGFVK